MGQRAMEDCWPYRKCAGSGRVLAHSENSHASTLEPEVTSRVFILGGYVRLKPILLATLVLEAQHTAENET